VAAPLPHALDYAAETTVEPGVGCGPGRNDPGIVPVLLLGALLLFPWVVESGGTGIVGVG